MRIISVLAAAVVAVPLALASAEESQALQEIRANCAAEWADDFAMQDYCIKRQVEAYASIRDDFIPLGRENEAIQGILERCFNEWRGKVAGFDFAMVHYCTQRQVEAYNRLQRGG